MKARRWLGHLGTGVLFAAVVVLASCEPSEDIVGPGQTRGQAAEWAGPQASTNWSGYVAEGLPHTFTKVSGVWTVPAVTCGGRFTASSAWTGIGGGNAADPTLIQAGTEQDCNGGAEYSAWWEALPAPSVTAGGGTLGLTAYKVRPGDRVAVTIDGSDLAVWIITIRNSTRGWTFTTTVPYTAAGETAEWIVEAPLSAGTGGAGETDLANYGRASFSMLTANGMNPRLNAGEAVEMVDANNRVISRPSSPGSGGNSFKVCFGSGSCS